MGGAQARCAHPRRDIRCDVTATAAALPPWPCSRRPLAGEVAATSSAALAAHGPIKIWMSNNPEEIAWAKAMVAAWNAAHPNEKRHRAGDPGRQDVRGGDRRGDHGRQRAVPGLQHLAGRRAAVPEAGRSGRRWTASRTARPTSRRAPGRRRDAVQVAGRQVLPAAVEVQPGDDLLQQGHPEEGRHRHRPNPPLETYDEFLATSQKIVSSGAAKAAIYPAPTSEFFQSVVRLLPAVRGRERRQAAASRTARPRSTPRPARPSPDFWQTMYDRGLAPQGEVQRRLLRRQEGRDGDRRAVGHRRLHRTRSTGASCRCRPPTGTAGRPDPDVHRRQERRDVLRLQEPGHGLGRAEVRDERGRRTARCWR